MELLLRRMWTTDESSIGCLYVNNTWECYTLEDPPGETLIPDGLYPVILDWSPKFEQIMPHVMHVPGHDGIRIHPGNTSADVAGCIAVGDKRGTDAIWESRKAFSRLFCRFLEAKRARDTVMLKIQKG